jgi:hypothetical protein
LHKIVRSRNSAKYFVLPHNSNATKFSVHGSKVIQVARHFLCDEACKDLN